MNDVLPKPFTKEGMLRALEKHLPQFKKNAQFPVSQSMPHPGGFTTPVQSHPPLGLNMGQLSAAQSLKDENSPGKSPATASSWHSPNQLPGQSPLGGPPTNFMQQPGMQQPGPFAMAPIQQAGFPPSNPPLSAPRVQQHRRVMSDMTAGPPPDEHADKRQRTAMYPPAPGNFPQ
jgi:osomolarity two-component system response regulator SKN7